MHVLTKSTFAALLALTSATAFATAETKTATFAVTRNDARIGTSTIRIDANGQETTVASTTHVAVRLAFLTVYRFDQTETEQWAQGRWTTITASTDDNGTLHRTSAANSPDGITVQHNGTESRIGASVIPASLWNDAIVTQSTALDPLDGRIVPVKVIDRGEEGLSLEGRPVRARHYVLTTAFSQDVWYDASHELVQLELKGRDGSVIRYQRV